MRKKLLWVGGLVALVVVLSSSIVLAAGLQRTITVLYNSASLRVNGQLITADNILYNGVTYVPLRAVADALGKDVGWDQATMTAMINDRLGTAAVSHSVFKLVGAPALRTVKSNEQLATNIVSCAYIEVYNHKGVAVSTGSGVFLTNDGIFVTNYHVISEGFHFSVTTHTGFKYTEVDLIGWDPKLDLAFLKVRGASTVGIPIAPDRPALGAEVLAIGSPLGFVNSVTQGIVSGFPEIVGLNFIQTSAAISPGSSGGALLNKYGELTGVTTAKVIGGENLNLAVSSSDISSAIRFVEENPGRVGTIRYTNATYHGEILNGQKHGYGSLTWHDGGAYQGNYVAGQQHGLGTMYWSNGDSYSGEWDRGAREGYGTYEWPNGDKYLGHHSNGEMDGYGVYTYGRGGSSQGFWIDGQMSGYSINYGVTGVLVKYLENGLAEGVAVLYLTDGAVASSVFLRGEMIPGTTRQLK